MVSQVGWQARCFKRFQPRAFLPPPTSIILFSISLHSQQPSRVKAIMKFGRYLAENQTPEWKRAYIDYRACKKKIKVINNRLRQIDGEVEEEKDSSDADEDHGPSAPPRKSGSIRSPSITKQPSREGNASGTTSRQSDSTPRYGATGTSPRPTNRLDAHPPPLDLGESSYESAKKLPELFPQEARSKKDVSFSPIVHGRSPEPNASSPEGSVKRLSDDPSVSDSGQPLNPGLDRTTSKMSKSPRFKSPRFFSSPRLNSPKPSTQAPSRRSIRSATMPSPRIPQSFDELYSGLEDDERDFFDLLQHELEKVESFYHAREMEAIRRAHDLRDQLRELAEHRRIFHELYPSGLADWEATVGRILPTSTPATGIAKAVNKLRIPFTSDEPQGNGKAGHPTEPGMDKATEGRLREAMAADKDHQTYSPERYQKYKKELRAAVMDFYRQLELIKNYRIMNLTGFRKALKKFEKGTKIHCLELYTDEKISPESFAKGETIENLIKQMETLYTEHFEHGDSKKARDKLRRQFQESTHYRSIFRSGVMIGLGAPAAVFAIVQGTVTYCLR
ncbi:SPX domain-domain-containing protein [Naematelia encephala]|uniref:SPX domain-domain-containing protein n=1 Tax=Naematelia encephala TaxID=71784 RepID=A0A1Y2BEU9_9TREE|nr:SPX domain-domain-containing protein [Naematelia encephala]